MSAEAFAPAVSQTLAHAAFSETAFPAVSLATSIESLGAQPGVAIETAATFTPPAQVDLSKIQAQFQQADTDGIKAVQAELAQFISTPDLETTTEGPLLSEVALEQAVDGVKTTEPELGKTKNLETPDVKGEEGETEEANGTPDDAKEDTKPEDMKKDWDKESTDETEDETQDEDGEKEETEDKKEEEDEEEERPPQEQQYAVDDAAESARRNVFANALQQAQAEKLPFQKTSGADVINKVQVVNNSALVSGLLKDTSGLGNTGPKAVPLFDASLAVEMTIIGGLTEVNEAGIATALSAAPPVRRGQGKFVSNDQVKLVVGSITETPQGI